MAKPKVNYALDWLAYFGFAALAGTGLLLHFKLPHGVRDATLLGLTRHDWGDVHFWIAAGFLVVVAVHLLLHATWIRALTVGKASEAGKRRRAGVAIAAGAVGVAIAFGVLLAPAPAPPLPRGGAHGQAAAAGGQGAGRGEKRGPAPGQGQGRGQGWRATQREGASLAP